ncbi:MAG: hypothetical protein AAF514_08285 [Verrucomicrobiota bacterium]
MKFCLVLLAHVILAGAIWFTFEKRKVENEHLALVPEPDPVITESQSRETISPLAGLLGGMASDNGTSGNPGNAIQAIVRSQAGNGLASDQLTQIRQQIQASANTGSIGGESLSPQHLLQMLGKQTGGESLSSQNLLNMLGSPATSDASIEARKQVEVDMQKLLRGLSGQ